MSYSRNNINTDNGKILLQTNLRTSMFYNREYIHYVFFTESWTLLWTEVVTTQQYLNAFKKEYFIIFDTAHHVFHIWDLSCEFSHF